MSEGFVKLVNKMEVPADVTIVNCARQSYGRRIETLGPKDISVIDTMMRMKHGTPFEGPVFQFWIRCTIKEARDWFRYRAGSSFNEYSTRFSKRIEDEYIPPNSAIRTGSVSGGKFTLSPVTDSMTRALIQEEFITAYDDAKRHYENLLKLGCAQELSSMVYPLGQMTEFTWTANARTLFNFFSQRMDTAALLELRRKAYLTYSLVEPEMPEACRLWTEHRQPDMFTDWSEGDPWLPEELQ